jgi:hypothetical protein
MILPTRRRARRKKEYKKRGRTSRKKADLETRF